MRLLLREMDKMKQAHADKLAQLSDVFKQVSLVQGLGFRSEQSLGQVQYVLGNLTVWLVEYVLGNCTVSVLVRELNCLTGSSRSTLTSTQLVLSTTHLTKLT